MRKTVYSPKTCVTLCVVIVTRLNDMKDEASKGKLLSDLPDKVKKDIASCVYEGSCSTLP